MTQFAVAVWMSATRVHLVEIVVADDYRDAVINFLKLTNFPESALSEVASFTAIGELLDALDSVGVHVVVTDVPSLN